MSCVFWHLVRFFRDVCVFVISRWHLLIGAAHQKWYQVQTWRPILKWEVCWKWSSWKIVCCFLEKILTSSIDVQFVYLYRKIKIDIQWPILMYHWQSFKEIPNWFSKFSSTLQIGSGSCRLAWGVRMDTAQPEVSDGNNDLALPSIFQKEAAKNAWISNPWGFYDFLTENRGRRGYILQRSSEIVIWWLPP